MEESSTSYKSRSEMSMEMKHELCNKVGIASANGSGDRSLKIDQNGKRSLWNVGEVAAFLGVPDRTVRDWVYRRVIPFRKAGKNVRFDPEEVERWTLPSKE